MTNWIRGSVTDALGRPEPKMALGILCILAALAYGFWAAVIEKKPDWYGFGAIGSLGTVLMGASAIMDDRNDSRPPRPAEREGPGSGGGE